MCWFGTYVGVLAVGASACRSSPRQERNALSNQSLGFRLSTMRLNITVLCRRSPSRSMRLSRTLSSVNLGNFLVVLMLRAQLCCVDLSVASYQSCLVGQRLFGRVSYALSRKEFIESPKETILRTLFICTHIIDVFFPDAHSVRRVRRVNCSPGHSRLSVVSPA